MDASVNTADDHSSLWKFGELWSGNPWVLFAPGELHSELFQPVEAPNHIEDTPVQKRRALWDKIHRIW